MEALINSENTPAMREQLFIALYQKAFPAVARYVSKMGGSFDEAKDIFQDALVIYYEKAVAETIAIKTNERAYLLGIAKFLWLQKFRTDKVQVPLNDFDTEMLNESASFSTNKLMHYLATAGQKCMEVLKAFYYDNLPVKQLAETFGYTSTHSATVQKYKCLEKVRDTVKQKSLSYEDFLD
ncbi:RNA polymerase sigma factor [Mucilaginibacter agri]|uniref:Sigma-70 family RNA polymerase sigma factor n=1 Tax=Mucilaginibacter agri TaxID=2695265 RepID=A0A965ZHG7_9SPHI|nr:sigma-70 family RNA polymerase sigma factor [Mucilaginibacter agri]NCD71164.1 sigma-70 family RNA polymerase sigma factor [Mucilaginibacter agri]